jgi:amino acid transporter/mannitol/fructose-specific phosphotransferase system IIA component (Ntr-type)
MKRALGTVGLFSIAAGAMISSGVFVLPGIVFSQVGPGLWISYLIAGVIATIGVFGVVELTTAMPRAGGNYFYVMRSLGPLFGTLSGVMSWFALTLKSAFAIYGLSLLAAEWLGLPSYPIAAGLVLLFVALNLFGAEAAGGVETVLVVALLAIIAAVIGLGWNRIDAANLQPMLLEGRGTRDVLIAAGLVFVSYGGLVNISSVAGEVRNPARVIPIATIGALVVVTALYTLLIRTAVGVVGAEQIDGATNPIARAAGAIAGTPGFVAVTVAAVLAFVTTAIAGMLSASRYPLALARDGLVPAFLGRVSGRRGVPVISVAVTGALMIGALALDLRALVEAASVVIAVSYLLTNVSLLVMRSSGLVGYRPGFRTPFYPVVPIVSIIAFTALIVDMGWEAIALSSGFVVVSLLVYLLFGRRAEAKEYALQHLVERLTSRELTGGDLEGELREIVHESRGIVTDRFDELVNGALCIDVPEAKDIKEVFGEIASRSATLVGMNEEEILRRLLEREAESSTALSDFVAVPHLVIPGTNSFHLVLVRSVEGIRFSTQTPEIKAMFVLMGTADERNFHLRALTAIAQICQDPTFDDAWLAVRKERQLADLVLMRSRRRGGADTSRVT